MSGEESDAPAGGRSPRIGPGGLFEAHSSVFDRALALVEYLRENCPWDRRQTPQSLVPHLIEEVHETVDAIHAEDPAALQDELGDLLLNVAFQVVLAEEARQFGREDVVRSLEEKMVRRHPHLFGEGGAEAWESIKAAERSGGTLDGLPSGLDPLLRAHRIQEKVAGIGFDWEEAGGALEKVREEIEEVQAALVSGEADALEEEIGDLLFSAVNLARLSGVHALATLTRANRKFESRFRALEALAEERELALPGATLDELDELWEEVKRREGSQ